MSAIDSILDDIKDESLIAIKNEFIEIFKAAILDNDQFIKQQAENLELILSYQKNGLVASEDVLILLKKQKKVAQIYANTKETETKVRVQKLVYRILDISIDVLLKAIIPI